jgi:molecular chaperone DnaK (HSP70)
MPASGFALGVDFGTSNTVAVLRSPDGRARSLLVDGSPLLPSAVYADPGGSLLVGKDAIHSARLDPARFEPNPKRRIDDHSVLLGDRELPVVDLVAAVLVRIAEEARRTTGGAVPDPVTLTCPAGWGPTRRGLLCAAAALAGWPRVRLVEEPVAAATYFTNVLGRQVPVGSVVVVHDFGAGTFDVSVVAKTADGFDVLAVDGRDDIGGLDIDAAIVTHLGRLHGTTPEWQRLTQPTTIEDRRNRRLLWDDVRAAKERLSRSQTADIPLPGVGTDAHLTRGELEDLARPVLEQTVRVTEGALRWAKLAEGRLAGVFLVGGASRTPLVATLLHRALGEPPLAIEQPELVVAEGSLYATSIATTRRANTVLFERVAAAPVSARPVSAPPRPPLPVSVPPGPSPTSAPPARPVSASPVSPPPPVSASPMSQSPARPVSPPPPPPVRSIPPAAVRVPQPTMIAPRPVPQPPPGPARSAVTYGRQPNVFLRALRLAIIVATLIAVPVTTAYLAFHFAEGTPAWPLDLTW